jgi:hypothetical protein
MGRAASVSKSLFAESPSRVRGLPMIAAMLGGSMTAQRTAQPDSEFDEAWDEARRRRNEVVNNPIGGD